MRESDCNYFKRRAAEEREAAMRSSHPSARRSHLELADRYEAIAQATNRSFLNLDVAKFA